MFPFEIRLKKRLGIKDLELEKTNMILAFFEQEFINRKADRVRIGNNEVRFNNKLFKFTSNWNTMVPVDKGSLTVKKNRSGELVIEYLFSLKVPLIVGVFFGIITFLFTKMWFVGVGVFLWLGVVNWLIALLRHENMFALLTCEMKRKISI